MQAAAASCASQPAAHPPPSPALQLWGAALPINSPRVPAIWDPMGRAGVCGDWVLEGGSMQVGGWGAAAGGCRVGE